MRRIRDDFRADTRSAGRVIFIDLEVLIKPRRRIAIALREVRPDLLVMREDVAHLFDVDRHTTAATARLALLENAPAGCPRLEEVAIDLDPVDYDWLVRIVRCIHGEKAAQPPANTGANTTAPKHREVWGLTLRLFFSQNCSGKRNNFAGCVCPEAVVSNPK
jgi:hypothetical protein